MKIKIPIDSFYVIGYPDADTDGEGTRVRAIPAMMVDDGEEMEFLPVFVSREAAEGSNLMESIADNFPRDRLPGTHGMTPRQLEGYLRENPNIGAVLLYPDRELLLRRADFFEFLENVEPGPDVEDVSGLSA